MDSEDSFVKVELREEVGTAGVFLMLIVRIMR